MWGQEHFRLCVYGKPIELLTDHQALEPLIKRNRSNETYSAILTSCLDQLAHFDINIKHIAGKHLTLTDYLSRNPISKPDPNENYDEEYVINCIIPLLEFINTHGSITDEKKLEAQTDEVAALANSQSQSSLLIKKREQNNTAQRNLLIKKREQNNTAQRKRTKQTVVIEILTKRSSLKYS